MDRFLTSGAVVAEAPGGGRSLDCDVEPGLCPGTEHARYPEVAPPEASFQRRWRGRKTKTKGGTAVAVVTMRQLLEAGVHFGHQTRRWNPKMRRFIFGERNGIYIVDLHQTLAGIDTAYRFVRDTVANGGSVLFVGTKKQAQEPVQREAGRVGQPYVNFRWLGGMLTNFQTVHSRVAKLRELQRIVDSGEVDQMIKKEGLKVRRDLAKLERNLGGIKNLETLPSALFVIDTKKEHIAVTEAKRLHIPVVAVVDTNCDPDLVDYVIPGNDDAIRSAQLMSRVIADAVHEGRHIAQRRGARAGTRAEEAAPKAKARTPEEEREFQERQAQARAAAAAKQKEIEERARRGGDGDGSGTPAAPAPSDTPSPPAAEAATPTEGATNG
jgi:small subunit ribosomal protein S2